jgi:hypothetical protein
LARATALGACVLGLVVACGGDDSSKAEPGVGGDGSGNTGNTGTGNTGSGNTGGNTSAENGEFGSIWKQLKSEVLVYDTESGGLPKNHELDMPALYPVPETDREVEMYVSIKDDQLVTYAFVQGTTSYYVVKSELLGSADDGYAFSELGHSGNYLIDDGVLMRTDTFGSNTSFATTQTTYQKYTGDFPPQDWPTEVVELDLTKEGAL